MGETSSQIERHIQTERGQLGQNLNELQSKVQEVTDWRVQFQKRPMMMMGLAIGGGALLASMTGRRSWHRRHVAEIGGNGGQEHRRGTELQRNKALESLDTIKGAMIGVAANTIQDFLGQLVPGFREQFHKTAQEKQTGAASTDSMRTPTQTASM